MSWTDERIATLKTMWEAGQTASQIAEALGGVSRNAVIGKAHRLELQARPSPVKPNDPEAKAAAAAEASASAAAAASEPVAPSEPVEVEAPKPAPVAAPVVAAAKPAAPVEPEPVADEPEDDEDEDEDEAAPAVAAPVRAPQPILRSVGPGGFLRQAPGEQQPPSTPAPPRRLVPAKPSAEMANKTSLLELNDRICKWPLGHPGEPDFHFCGKAVNPGFPYCVDHCGHAYQAQLPRRDRRPTPPLPFGGPRPR
ncbi:GcrA cell cycle regulator [Sphingomonas sp. PP-F2F-G114-C0414]|uniref:GcrA family cell cycle regulator n=1 Tax=Sphingomonas sp. PP-F2F-G114-C0414 TaxID=2135662 RepID=UPI000EF8AFE7|nr:GcrA family cell cycle regulator [Sphingomonas sp. PP-F2F-G114-C0414]RMB34211.1 GcrA cell cycle regulator [Sphingomonas sp. PP-F2F-G114-C0414]